MLLCALRWAARPARLPLGTEEAAAGRGHKKRLTVRRRLCIGRLGLAAAGQRPHGMT